MVSEKASSVRGDWLWWLRGARRVEATIFLASCARKSRERNGKKANKFLPLADKLSTCLWQEVESAHAQTLW